MYYIQFNYNLMCLSRLKIWFPTKIKYVNFFNVRKCVIKTRKLELLNGCVQKNSLIIRLFIALRTPALGDGISGNKRNCI